MRRLLASFAKESKPKGGPWVSARFRADADEERFTDADILTILRAGEDAANVADLCAAQGIAVSTYYVWKVRYGGLPTSQMKRLRLRARMNGRTMIAAVALVVAGVGAGYPFIAPRRAVSAQQSSAVLPNPVVQPLSVQALPVRAPAADAGPQVADPTPDAPQGTGVGQPMAARAGETQVIADDIEVADPSGYSVQVAALPDLWEARALLKRLAGDGYPAYLTRTAVNHLQLYRVRVGPLKSPIEAREVTRRLELEGHRAPWVTK
jgi:putative transposase